MQCVPFVCYETPYCVWDPDPIERNLEYIRGIDPEFFNTSATAFGQLLGDDVRSRHAATGLRLLYTHALETLLALLGATAQAPQCVFAWLLKYREPHLRDFVESVSQRRKVKHRLNVDQVTWTSISEFIHQFVNLEDKEKERRIKRGFGRFWEYAAGQYLNETSKEEYNSIKHALRVQSGGHVLKIGFEHEFGVPPPPEEMKTVMASDFGSSFLTAELLGEDKVNFGLKRHSTGWHPQALIHGIQLVALSVSNLKSCLLACHGTDPTALQWHWPQDLSLLELRWVGRAPGSESTSFGASVDERGIRLLTKEKILGSYERSASPID